jgi:hypothetical protein
MYTLLVPHDGGGLSVDDETVDIDELASAIRMRTQRQNAGEPLAQPWLASITPEDDEPILPELSPAPRLQDHADRFIRHGLSVIFRQLAAFPQEPGEAL